MALFVSELYVAIRFIKNVLKDGFTRLALALSVDGHYEKHYDSYILFITHYILSFLDCLLFAFVFIYWSIFLDLLERYLHTKSTPTYNRKLRMFLKLLLYSPIFHFSNLYA